MEIHTDEALLGGVAPAFVVDVTSSGASYTGAGQRSSIDDLVLAIRAAATHKSPIAGIVVALLIASIVAVATRPWLLVLVAVAGIAWISFASARAVRRRRVPVVYHLDQASTHAFESLGNGVAWLGSTRALWCVTHEEVSQRPANTTSVTRVPAQVLSGDAPNVLTNIPVPRIDAGGQTLHLLPDVLLVRNRMANFTDIAYSSLRVDCETTHFSDSQGTPSDSRQVGQSWLYANKNGTPDRRRRDNRAIPVLEYGRVVLTWRGSGCVLLVSSLESARRFAEAVQAMIRFRSPAAPPRAATEKPMLTIAPRTSTLPTDLERALQASIDRKQRLQELEREAAAVVKPTARQPVADTNASWIAEGGSTTVQGYATGDLVYIGRRIPSLDGSGIEPSAIDPMLPVDSGHANTSGDGVSYWPSYSSISAASRTAYLRWLAGGRKDPDVYIGYVFIFFYGLERRVYEFIHKRGSHADEVLVIAREVARLLDLHADRSDSFASYGAALLDLIACIEPRARAVARRQPFRDGYGVPMPLAIELGELALAGNPIPAKLAYDWVRAIQFLNTPASRCEREFELLFHIRYAKQFGGGLLVPPAKTLLELRYRPASAALDPLEVRPRNVPDVTQLTRPQEKLASLAQECTNALDAFSRFLGKNPDARQSLAAFALLPDELVEGTHSADAKALAALVVSRLDGNGRAHLAAGELLQYVRIAKPDKVSKSEAMLLAQSLEKLGYGIEPDVRLGGPVFDLDGRVVVFRRLPDCPSTASDEYATAALLIRLGVMVGAADESVSEPERNLLERHIEERLQLTSGERQRLTAHLAWLAEADLGMTGIKRKIEALPQQARRAVGELLVDLAAEDGSIDPREMKVLEKIYAVLELPASDLYRDVHAAHAEDDQPVVVDTPTSAPRGFAIPPKPAAAPAPGAGLDMSRVHLKIAETRQVSALLGSIFVEEEAPPAVAPAIAQAGTIGTLDTAHSELLRRLAERKSWPRAEVERLAAELSLLPDGALETINDYAYTTADEPFWEDDDPLAINSNVAMELIR